MIGELFTIMECRQIFTGKIASGVGKAAFFTQLDWVTEQCVTKLGFSPFPGTLNVRVADDCDLGGKILQTGNVIELLSPDAENCSARVVPILLEGVAAVVIIPEGKVRIHGWDIIEIMAPVNLRKTLLKEDGDSVSGSLEASGSWPERLLKPVEKLTAEAIMLDLDGTIIDSVGIYYEIVGVTLEKLGLPEVSTEQIREANLNGSFLWEKLFPEGLFDDQAYSQEKAWAIARKISPELFNQRVKLLPGAAQLLKRLARGGFKLAIVTSTPQQNMSAKLKPLDEAGILPLLQEIITADDTTRKKPAADPLVECCRRLEIDPEKCIYVGDTQVDIQAGQAAGSRTVGVLTGFDTYEMLEKEKPDAIIASLAGLLEVVSM